jgi:hypothetical protein
MSAALNNPPLVVLKFGSSVLRTVSDLPCVVSEIYRHIRVGEHVLARRVRVRGRNGSHS